MIDLVLALSVATRTPTPAPFIFSNSYVYEKMSHEQFDGTISAEFVKAGITPTVISTRFDAPKSYVWIERGLFVDLQMARLYVIRAGDAMASFECSYGRLDRNGKTITPTGVFRVTAKKDLSHIGDDPKYGTRFIRLDIRPTGKQYLGIHGTNEPEKIGKPVSDGCIRLRNEDVEKLFELINTDEPVEIHR